MKRVRTVLLTAAAAGLIASKPKRHRIQAQRILRISRVVADLARAEAFYRDALGFRAVRRGRADATVLGAFGLPDGAADEVVMRLGEETIALVRFAAPGRPYPSGSRSNDLWFQHLAIVVSDMDAAYGRLARQGGWQPISDGGPQLLPPSNGGVRAFKFRDPDGHPLELIWFPPGQGRAVWHDVRSEELFLGVDHSALSIRSTLRSRGFYRSLGMRVSDRSLNHGPAQNRLDGLPGVRVRVTALRPASTSGPGLELLGYHPAGRVQEDALLGDVVVEDMVTDWVTILAAPLSGDLVSALRDPDGHLLVLVDQGAVAMGLPA